MLSPYFRPCVVQHLVPKGISRHLILQSSNLASYNGTLFSSGSLTAIFSLVPRLLGSLRTRLATLATETPNLVLRFARAAVCGAGTRLFAYLWVKGQISTCAVDHVGGEARQKEMEPGSEEYLLEQRWVEGMRSTLIQDMAGKTWTSKVISGIMRHISTSFRHCLYKAPRSSKLGLHYTQ